MALFGRLPTMMREEPKLAGKGRRGEMAKNADENILKVVPTLMPKVQEDEKEKANARGLGHDIFHLPPGMNAGGVVRDYLKQVHGYIWNIEALKSLQDPKVLYVFTVPASFSKPAQLAIKDAASEAGFRDGTIYLVKEPEGAATHVFERGLLSELKEYEKIMVVDLGGGTVDIATYMASKVEDTLQTKYLEPSEGLVSLPAYYNHTNLSDIDRNFHDLLSSRFGQKFSKQPVNCTGPGSPLMELFEYYKRTMTGDEASTKKLQFYLPMDLDNPNPRHHDADAQEIILSMDDWGDIFTPVLDEIKLFIQDQFNKAKGPFKYIVLVGGLANIPWIRNAIRQSFHSDQTLVICCPQPELAVVRGALGRLSSDFKQLVISPWYYGVGNLKNEEITWLFNKDEQYSDGKSPIKGFTLTHKQGDSKCIQIPVYGCNRANSPRFTKGNGVLHLGYFTLDLRTINLGKMWHVEGDEGRLEYKIEFTRQMAYVGKAGVLQIRALTLGGMLIGKLLEMEMDIAAPVYFGFSVFLMFVFIVVAFIPSPCFS
ncbi:actin-like ATPase domain-containing protein [Aspergillus sclerotioniger CBS 115572]|uniref:Actin-like ATPase domain-containing protein n=1 Tax=Aspergillus sclerotioniger CBS 115572 TaxID=1450535 RepID=A0A317V115_9EURO|nr:actin-like ATPase domain-containing protein [Aspergillus sclerotioniger CBS 115572]PWY67963.1 actin-like ATPase domain-containing protein [Aspergillus sclerotioniger CBS 115572]